MARIRTIKPEFFTSEDIVELTPLARLLYIALWCEADKEGRFSWKPRTFKMRYLPGDDCDIAEVCNELVSQGLVVLYGEGLAYVPSFTKHQHVNPRESASVLPDPQSVSRVSDASARVDAPSVTRREEGKGREGKEGEEACLQPAPSPASKKGTRISAEWKPDNAGYAEAVQALGRQKADAEVCKFRDYWISKPGKDGLKLDWDATWRNWVRRASEFTRPTSTGPISASGYQSPVLERNAGKTWAPEGSDAYEAWKRERPKLIAAMREERRVDGVIQVGAFLPTVSPPKIGVAA